MPIYRLPASLHGKTLMQISDIHIGDRFDYKHIISAFEKAKLLKPDIVVYTGDFVTLSDDQVRYDKLKLVLEKMVRGTIATCSILGNHDYGLNFREANVADQISEMLLKNGVIHLRNEKRNIGGLCISGIDDYWGTNFSPSSVLKEINPQDANLVLCHNPDVCDLDVWNNYKGWILSGHTHGGQVKPPFLPPLILPVKNKKYTAGHFPLADGRNLYINSGLGCLWPIRFNVRPEITIFTLEQAS